MIPEAVFREFPGETLKKLSISGRNPLENGRSSIRKSDNRIRLPVSIASRRFLAEPAKFGNQIRHRNTASMFRWIPVRTGPYFLTWAYEYR